MPERRYHSRYTSPRQYVCRIRGCHKKGFGHYCAGHTPKDGVGIIACLNCGKPTREHSTRKLCWEGDGPSV
jgi:hypothetical protein